MGACGCKGSKANSKVTAPASKTLLNAPSTDAKGGIESFPIFVDSLSGSSCFTTTSDASVLRVSNVRGGPIGLWNNRAGTKKVKEGDLVVKIREAGAADADWLSADAAGMLAALQARGVFEVVVQLTLEAAAGSLGAPEAKDTIDTDATTKTTEEPAEDAKQEGAVKAVEDTIITDATTKTTEEPAEDAQHEGAVKAVEEPTKEAQTEVPVVEEPALGQFPAEPEVEITDKAELKLCSFWCR